MDPACHQPTHDRTHDLGSLFADLKNPQEVQQRVKPLVHIFGHIHEGYGVSSDGTTTYVNACSCTVQYNATQGAIVFDLTGPGLDGAAVGSPVFVGNYQLC